MNSIEFGMARKQNWKFFFAIEKQDKGEGVWLDDFLNTTVHQRLQFGNYRGKGDTIERNFFNHPPGSLCEKG